jgi:hypothetical protein
LIRDNLTKPRQHGQVITLLDLRHRQATTENAISSAKQADQLFAQSQVLLVFTVATVIFVRARLERFSSRLLTTVH